MQEQENVTDGWDDGVFEELQARLETLRSRLEWHKARVGQLRARAAAEFDDQMTSLRQELEEARDEVSRLADSGGAAWKELETEFESAWHDLREAFETTTTRF